MKLSVNVLRLSCSNTRFGKSLVKVLTPEEGTQIRKFTCLF